MTRSRDLVSERGAVGQLNAVVPIRYEDAIRRRTAKSVVAAQRRRDPQSALSEFAAPAVEAVGPVLSPTSSPGRRRTHRASSASTAPCGLTSPSSLQPCDVGLKDGELDPGAQFQHDAFTVELAPRAVGDDDNFGVEWIYDPDYSDEEDASLGKGAWRAVDFYHDFRRSRLRFLVACPPVPENLEETITSARPG
jgi:hypothetical protein